MNVDAMDTTDTQCATSSGGSGNVDPSEPSLTSSTVPRRPPRRSAALAAQAALAQSSSSSNAVSHDPITLDGGQLLNGKQPEKWLAYLAHCRSQSSFSSRPLRTICSHTLTTDLLAYEFNEPFVMKDPPQTIGLAIPPNFSPDFVAQHAGGTDRMLDIIDVANQSEVRMTLADWVTYFKTPKQDRERVLNLLSLEISQQPLGQMIGRPWVVTQMDLVSRFWPSSRQHAGDMPNFQLYCLMGTEGSFTDFHIDFGGTSVFYHIIQGQKTFLFIKPTPANLRLYDAWVKSDTRMRGNLADKVSEVIEIHATAGQTLWIPSGWIHAVHTPVDTLVVGGNFLTSRYLASQISIHLMELGQSIDSKFLLPNFSDILWYTLDYFAHQPADRIDVQQAVELVHLCAFLAQHPLVIDGDAQDDADDAPSDEGDDPKRLPLPPGDLAWGESPWKVLCECVQRAYRVLLLWNAGTAEKVAKVVDNVMFVSMCAERGIAGAEGAVAELAKFTRVSGVGPGAGMAAVAPGSAHGAAGKKPKVGRPKKKVGQPLAAALNGPVGGAAIGSGKVDGKGKAKLGRAKSTGDDERAKAPATPVLALSLSMRGGEDPHDANPKAQRKSDAFHQPLERPPHSTSPSPPLSSVPASSSLPPALAAVAGKRRPPTRRARLHSSYQPLSASAVAELVHDDNLSSDEIVSTHQTRGDDEDMDRMDVDRIELPPPTFGPSRHGRKHGQGQGTVLMEFQLQLPTQAHGRSTSEKPGTAQKSDERSCTTDGPDLEGTNCGRKRSRRVAAASACLATPSTDDLDSNVSINDVKSSGRGSGAGRGRGRKSKPIDTAAARASTIPNGQPMTDNDGVAVDEDLIAAVSLVMPSSSSPVQPPFKPDTDELPMSPPPSDQRRTSTRLRATSSSASSLATASKPKRTHSDLLVPPKKRHRATTDGSNSFPPTSHTFASSASSASSVRANYTRRRRASTSFNSSDSAISSSRSSSESTRRRSRTSMELGLPYMLDVRQSSIWGTRLSQRRVDEIDAEVNAMLVAHMADEIEMGWDRDASGEEDEGNGGGTGKDTEEGDTGVDDGKVTNMEETATLGAIREDRYALEASTKVPAAVAAAATSGDEAMDMVVDEAEE